ncbi:MAG: extracellular solute-binding protein [Ruminococcaceae bacterium]|nr:extracellular solute-binding protein [Oscillospiraceae bacterium]
MLSKYIIRTAALALSLLLLFSTLGACTSKSVEEDVSESTPVTEPVSETEPEAEPETEPAELPEEVPETVPEETVPLVFTGTEIIAPPNTMELPLCEEVVTYDLFFSFPPPLAEMIDSLLYGPALEELTNRTNVSIEFYAVSAAVASERYSIMLASGDYPDILQDLSANYSPGLDQAIADGIIYNHTDLINDYIPIYAEVLAASEDIRLALTTTDGNIAGITRLYKEPSRTKLGNIIRQDWLDDLGLETPNTVAELTDVLQAFKTEKGATEPYYLNYLGYSSNFSITGAFETTYTFYQENGTVKFGPIEPGMKEYLETMHQWYVDGLVSPDYFSNISNYPNSGNVANGSIGVFLQEDSLLEDIYNYVTEDNKNLKLAAIPSTIMNEGDINHFGSGYGDWTGGTTWSISSNCEDPEPLCKAINYLFTAEGSLLGNYGVEGVSWNYDEDGVPRVNETITNNPEIGNNEAQLKYTLPFAPFVEDYARFLTGYTQAQIDAPIIWQSNSDKAYTLPTGLSMSTVYSDEYNSIYNDISTLVSENINKFITGEADISEFDSFVEQVTEMGIDRCIEIWQILLDEYKNK